MFKAKPKLSLKSEKGSVFTTLLAGVAMVGLLGIATFNLLSGPVATMARVNQKAMIQNDQATIGTIIITTAATSANNGDCEGTPDGYVEPIEWRDASGAGPDGVAGSDGGGYVPLTLGAPVTDPYGTEYGYCVWDVSVVDDAGCGGGTQRRLTGNDDPTDATDDDDLKFVIALISAGADRTFDTGCMDFVDDTTEDLVVEANDDIILTYSYSEAAAISSGLWTIKAADADTAEIDKDLEIGGDEASGGTFIGDQTVDSTAYTSVGSFQALKIDQIYGRTSTIIGLNDPFEGIFEVNPKSSPETLAAPYTTGAGVRMVFYPNRHAFRAGEVTGTQWDHANIGVDSVAMGLDTTASGASSFAMGEDAIASSQQSMAVGKDVTASTNDSAFAFGEFLTTTGSHSLIFGEGTSAGSRSTISVDNAVLFDIDDTSNAYTLAQANTFAIMGGKVGIGVLAPTEVLEVSGDAAKTVAGDWVAISDRRLKDILGPYEKGLDEITQLETIRYKYKKDNPRGLPDDIEQVGFVAQDVQKIFPEAVHEQEDGHLALDTYSIRIATVNAIKELNAENEALAGDIAALRADIDRLSAIAGLPEERADNHWNKNRIILATGLPMALLLIGAAIFRRQSSRRHKP